MAQPQSTERLGSGPVAAGVVLASGSGTRVGAELNKVYLPLAGRRVVAWSVSALARVAGVGVLVLVVRPQDRALVDEVLSDAALLAELGGTPVDVVHGGASRQESELMALNHLGGPIADGRIDIVLIHDAARPLVTPELAAAVLRGAREFGGVIPGLPRTDLVAVGEQGDPDGERVSSADLGRVVTVQTPQGFPAAALLAAYRQAAADDFVGTDTAACMARYSTVPTRCIPGDERNIKITYPYDVAIAERLLAGPRATDW